MFDEQSGEVPLEEVLVLIANKVSFVLGYKTLNVQRRKILNSVLKDLITLSKVIRSAELAIICKKIEGDND